VLAANFFPSDENRSLVLLKTLAVFGAAFVMRPIGGILMGWIGDTLGRKRALEISILLMLFPSFLIGCLPNYETAGWFSAGALVLFRLLQGLAAGGELVGAFLYTLEATDGNTKGFWGGACKASGNLGTTIGLALITLLRYVLTKDQLYSWGWRIPFWLGLLFGTLGVYARSKLKNEAGFEGEEFEEAKNSQLIGESPVKQVLREDWREIIMLVLVVALWGCAYYTTFIWLVYYLQDPDLIGDGTPAVWIVNLLSNILLVILLPFGGWFGDYLGDRMGNMEKGTIAAMKLSIYFLFIVLIPSFLLFMTRDPYLVWLGQTLLVFPIACFGANLPAFMVSRFPVALRFSGVGIGK
jgi:MHS family proline/betaine transporter-like MFS transporter